MRSSAGLGASTDAAPGYGLQPQEAAVVREVVLGDRSLIPEDLEVDFRRSSITHSLAQRRGR
jgi:competence protein ComEC